MGVGGGMHVGVGRVRLCACALECMRSGFLFGSPPPPPPTIVQSR